MGVRQVQKEVGFDKPVALLPAKPVAQTRYLASRVQVVSRGIPPAGDRHLSGPLKVRTIVKSVTFVVAGGYAVFNCRPPPVPLPAASYRTSHFFSRPLFFFSIRGYCDSGRTCS